MTATSLSRNMSHDPTVTEIVVDPENETETNLYRKSGEMHVFFCFFFKVVKMTVTFKSRFLYLFTFVINLHFTFFTK